MKDPQGIKIYVLLIIIINIWIICYFIFCRSRGTSPRRLIKQVALLESPPTNAQSETGDTIKPISGPSFSVATGNLF